MMTEYQDLPLTLRVTDVAKIMGVSTTVAYDIIKSPDFPSVKVGRRIYVPRDKFMRWFGVLD